MKKCTFNEGQFLFKLADLLGFKFNDDTEIDLLKEEQESGKTIYIINANGRTILKCYLHPKSKTELLGQYLSTNWEGEILLDYSINRIADSNYYVMVKDTRTEKQLIFLYKYGGTIELMGKIIDGMKMINNIADIQILTKEEESQGYALKRTKR